MVEIPLQKFQDPPLDLSFKGPIIISGGGSYFPHIFEAKHFCDPCNVQIKTIMLCSFGNYKELEFKHVINSVYVDCSKYLYVFSFFMCV